MVLTEDASDFTITESTIAGTNNTGGSVGEGLRNNYSDPGALANDDRIEYVGTPLHQNWTLENSYLLANGMQHQSEEGIEHQEDWWFSNNTIVANHDTLLNPSKQTAVIFAQGSNGPCENHETVENSLLAGGGDMFGICGHTTGAGSSTLVVKNNRFARRVCTKSVIADVEGRGGHECSGEPSERISYFDAGEGSGGYFPEGGFFGVFSEGEGFYPSAIIWNGNYWDNNLEEQPEQTFCPKC